MVAERPKSSVANRDIDQLMIGIEVLMGGPRSLHHRFRMAIGIHRGPEDQRSTMWCVAMEQ